MAQLQNVERYSTTEFSTASSDEHYVGVTKEESKETRNSESFRGCEYQAFADGILSPTMPSPISKEGIEQYLDFHIEDNKSISDLRAMLQDYVKSAEKAAYLANKFETTKQVENIANLQTSKHVGNDDTWSQITSLPMEKLRHASVTSEGKESKTGESSSYEIRDYFKPQTILLKKKKLEESSSYEIEEDDTKGQSSKIQNNQTYYFDAPSLVTLIPKYKGGLVALTESNSCSILIEEVKSFVSTPQQICYNALPAESLIGENIESSSFKKESLSTEIHPEIRYL